MERISLGVLFLSECVILSTCLLRHYHFVDQSLTWTEAQTYCRQTYTDLATVENSEEVNQLINTVSSAGHNSEVWVGLYHEINWRWSDGFNGSGAEYRSWAPDEPNFSSVDQYCVIVQNDLLWKDHFCRNSYPFICYRGTQQDPEYVVVNQTMTWFRAQSYCREKFIDLATVRNNTENQRIQIITHGVYAWIGLFRDPDFYWSDGTSFRFNNWDKVSNPVNSMRVICGVTSVERSGKWKFLSCETKLPFVCYSYPTPVKKQVVKMRLKVEDSVDLNNPDVKAKLLKKLQDRLKENGVSGVTLKWREQPDGEVFHKEEERKKTEL